MSDVADPNYDPTYDDAQNSHCDRCDAPYEVVRPGKIQPSCGCEYIVRLEQERDGALARCAELESILRIVHDHRGLCDSDANETFERTALLFYADTGMLRPGKDMSAASPLHSYEERRKAWHQWCDALNERIDEKIRQALRPASDPVDGGGA